MTSEEAKSTAAVDDDEAPPSESHEHDYADTEVASAAAELPAATGDEDNYEDDELPKVAGQRGRRRAKVQEDKTCSCCKGPFERQGRGFNRRAVFTFTTPEAAQWVFPDAGAIGKKSFVCETCAQVIRTKCCRKNNGKRIVWLKPAAAKQTGGRHRTKGGQRMGKKSHAAMLVSKSCYRSAFRTLWSAKGARKPMMDFLSRELREEMKALSRHADSPFHQKVSSKKMLAFFPWARCLAWAQERAPLVTTCLRSLFPTVGALVKSRQNIWTNNFLQAALGAKLRLQGCSGPALDTLNSLGLCQNKDTVRLRLHRLRGGAAHDKANGVETQDHMTDMEEDEDDEEEEEEEEEEKEDDDDDEEEEEEEQHPLPEELKKRRKKKKKRRRKREREDDDEEEEEEEERKRRVVVVRLDLLKGHSEVGRADLSAP
ncbi:bromodomain adjacent to zinc finger domain protein 2B-like isoform X2 [Syngnathoides biaculeatus]|uniref:bromodomain adjacent to zinc finger domain protein 2B-like isoform X2 n=1 Tax=Syngnathoides biaculeatus TaxID=300417 RepID=UPI002ADD71F7|nr:bromodomain adjacent to zinc finger domain protein 2B-like isoform X2 [Syngnathoides biaculeatus]